ncbi:MAG TPA: hypothetical protein VJ844_10870 [Mucilaginibacter sp.]|nr:hypothetical protein [Mucilaginibacter sp.]
METIDLLRENIAKHVCNKYQMPAFVIDTGKQVMVLCCCKEFTTQLKTDLEKEIKEDFKDIRVSFVTGYLDFL